MIFPLLFCRVLGTRMTLVYEGGTSKAYSHQAKGEAMRGLLGFSVTRVSFSALCNKKKNDIAKLKKTSFSSHPITA